MMMMTEGVVTYSLGQHAETLPSADLMAMMAHEEMDLSFDGYMKVGGAYKV